MAAMILPIRKGAVPTGIQTKASASFMASMGAPQRPGQVAEAFVDQQRTHPSLNRGPSHHEPCSTLYWSVSASR